MKASRNRPRYGYERVLTVFGIVVAVAMAATGLFVVGAAVVVAVALSNSGSNK